MKLQSKKNFPKTPQIESGITKDVLRKKRKKRKKNLLKTQKEQNSHKH